MHKMAPRSQSAASCMEKQTREEVDLYSAATAHLNCMWMKKVNQMCTLPGPADWIHFAAVWQISQNEGQCSFPHSAALQSTSPTLGRSKIRGTIIAGPFFLFDGEKIIPHTAYTIFCQLLPTDESITLERPAVKMWRCCKMGNNDSNKLMIKQHHLLMWC